MSTVLYRKYRPQSFSDVKGQQSIKDILVHSIKNKTFSHGYLFSGPRGTGKTSTARLFARAINDKDFNKKSDLTEYRDESIDIIEMDAASNRGIDEIRELRDKVNYLPAELDYKVYIIDEAHMLTKEAFNALLKTLEEPPKHVVFILATTEPHKIPVTILSRVTRLDFKLASLEQLKEKLEVISKDEKVEITDTALDKLFKLSGGSFRDAESMLAKLMQSDAKTIDEGLIDNVFGLLPEEGIKQFLEAFKKGNKDQVTEILNQVNDTFIDFLLEEALSYIVNSQAYTELIPALLNIIQNQKIFKDKKIYILANLVNISNQEPAEISFQTEKIVPADKPAKQAEPTPVPERAEVTHAEVKTEKIVQTKSENTEHKEDIVSKVAENIEKENKRLGTIIRTCEVIEIDENKIVLGNKYNFNIKYLNQKGNLQEMLKEFKKINEEINKIELVPTNKVRKIKDNPSKTKSKKSKEESKSEETIENDFIEKPMVLNDSPKEQNSSTNDDKKDSDKEDYDNSELVESIL